MTHVGKERLLKCCLLGKSACLYELILLELVVIHLEQHTVRADMFSIAAKDALASYLIPMPLSIAIEVGLHLARI